MGNCMKEKYLYLGDEFELKNHIKQKEFVSDDVFEIKNGIVGINRVVVFRLIKLMYFRSDELMQNLIGMCGECVNLLDDSHFIYYKKNPKPNLKKQLIKNPLLERKKDVEINNTNLVFKLSKSEKYGSLFLNVLVKMMIFECTIRVEFHQDDKEPRMCVGISTPSQLNETMGDVIGHSLCGAGFYLSFSNSRILCDGNWSYLFNEGGLKDGEIVTTLINQMNKEGFPNYYGKMNLTRFGKRLPHTIINIPLIEGVYLGFSSDWSSLIIHIISLHKLRVPPPNIYNYNGLRMRCAVYDYEGKFDPNDIKDEEGKLIVEKQKYYAF